MAVEPVFQSISSIPFELVGFHDEVPSGETRTLSVLPFSQLSDEPHGLSPGTSLSDGVGEMSEEE